MRLAVFRQEEFFERYEFACRHMLALSGVEPLRHGELIALAGEGPPPSLELGYTPSAGFPELRAAIAALHPPAKAEHVIVTVGAIEALLIVMNLLLGAGDELVCLWPSYQPLHELATAAGAHVRFAALDPRDGFRLTFDMLREQLTDRTRLVVLNVPHNPTGRTLPADELRAFARELASRDIALLVDEVFRELTPDHGPSAWDGSPNLLVAGGLSKAYGLPGLRIGWLVAAPELVVEARRFRKYTSLNPGALDQAWALRVLASRERVLARTHKLAGEGRRHALAWFAAHEQHFELEPPESGALLFPRLRSGEDTEGFCRRLVEQTGVLFAPGSACYEVEGHLRVGFATPQLADGLERVAEHLAR